jgi:flavin-dependent dehydrogenase
MHAPEGAGGAKRTAMTAGSPDFDIGILGGGPAGAAMASYLAKAGVSCVVFERELFPRPHVGESLVPSSTRVFKELGFIDTMHACQFPRKYGAAWTSETGGKVYRDDFSGLAPDCIVDVAFAERDQAGVDLPYTWHVDRGKFDLALLQHANGLGATVYEGIKVQTVEFPDDDWVRIHYQMGPRECTTTVRTVIDASGRRTIIGNQLNWKVMDPVFDQYALHSWFEGYDRTAVCGDPSKRDLIFIHFLPITNTWVWQIPITDDITSIGVVTQKANFKTSRTSREQFFWDAIASRPDFHAAVKASTQQRSLKAEGDYSYAMKKICDDRVILIGDAARFVDPIFSTGVSIALNSARFASRDVLTALETGDFSRSSFSNYESTLRRGTKNWHEFITVYYRLNVLFTAFIMDPRYRIDVLKLLQGDVYDEDAPAVLTKMKNIVTAVEQDESHVWHQLLGDLTANAFAPAY